MQGLTTLTLVSFLKLSTIIFYLGLYVMDSGNGILMPCIVSFGVDQYDHNNSKGRRLKSSFLNWFFFVSNFGPLLSNIVVVLVEDNVSWELGFGISTLIIGFSMGDFYSGTPIYRHQKSRWNPCHMNMSSDCALRVNFECGSPLIKAFFMRRNTRRNSLF